MSRGRSHQLAIAPTLCECCAAEEQLAERSLVRFVEQVTATSLRPERPLADLPTHPALLPPPLPADVFADESLYAFDDETWQDGIPAAIFCEQTQELPRTVLDVLLPEAVFGWMEETHAIERTADDIPLPPPLPLPPHPVIAEEIEGPTLPYDRVRTRDLDQVQATKRREAPMAHLPLHVQLACR